MSQAIEILTIIILGMFIVASCADDGLKISINNQNYNLKIGER